MKSFKNIKVNMWRKSSFVLMLLCFVLFFSCRKTIKVKLPEYKQKVVIEASIETNGYAYVLLSYSIPFFGDFDFTQPTNAFIKGAFVTVSDGTQTDTLKELDPNTGYYYLGSKVKGVQGKTYYLEVTVNGKTYKANTFIHPPVALDSLYFKGEKDTLGYMWAHITEPAGLGNNYRWFAKRLNRGDLFYAAPFNSVFDDKFVDGKEFHFAYDRGPQPNQIQDNKDDPEAGWFKRGDTVVVKFCTIGRPEYNFWYSYYLNKSSNGNPFSAPTNIVSMTAGEDVMGGFFGYSPSYDTLVIPK
jgi:hypothetical protein